eukprot:TRINITY_DN3168_c0_g1_i4.p1 TRINITY_DN3168_c0_g1~~TRINITY_DN3168_c0_g1_i4.p1  ORF type:complete len:732 (+),score=173.74 TRINITY_DN3168_c0_g1_i4:387-2582(+)
MKFQGTSYFDKIRSAPSPEKAAELGASRKHPLRPDWEDVKMDVMREIVLCKFQQNEECQKLLLTTGNKQIVEHNRKDSFWGDGADGRGANHMGQILMSIREELQGEREVPKKKKERPSKKKKEEKKEVVEDEETDEEEFNPKQKVKGQPLKKQEESKSKKEEPPSKKGKEGDKGEKQEEQESRHLRELEAVKKAAQQQIVDLETEFEQRSEKRSQQERERHEQELQQVKNESDRRIQDLHRQIAQLQQEMKDSQLQIQAQERQRLLTDREATQQRIQILLSGDPWQGQGQSQVTLSPDLGQIKQEQERGSITFSFRSPGNPHLTLVLDGSQLQPLTVDPSRSSLEGLPPQFRAGQLVNVDIEVKDTSGKTSTRQHQVHLLLEGQAFKTVPAKKAGDKYRCSFQCEKAGEYRSTLVVDDHVVGKEPRPFTVTPADPHVPSFTISLANHVRVVTGVVSFFTVTPRDRFGNPLRFPGETEMSATVKGPSHCQGLLTDTGDTHYQISIFPTRPGSHALHVLVDGQSVPPFSFEVEPLGPDSVKRNLNSDLPQSKKLKAAPQENQDKKQSGGSALNLKEVPKKEEMISSTESEGVTQEVWKVRPKNVILPRAEDTDEENEEKDTSEKEELPTLAYDLSPVSKKIKRITSKNGDEFKLAESEAEKDTLDAELPTLAFDFDASTSKSPIKKAPSVPQDLPTLAYDETPPNNLPQKNPVLPPMDEDDATDEDDTMYKIG